MAVGSREGEKAAGAVFMILIPVPGPFDSLSTRLHIDSRRHKCLCCRAIQKKFNLERPTMAE